MINRALGLFRPSTFFWVCVSLLLSVPAIAATELDFSSPPVITPAVNPDVPQSALWTNVGEINGIQIDVKATVLGKKSNVNISIEGDDAKFLLDGSDMEITVSYEFFISGTNTPLTIIPKILARDIDTGDWGKPCVLFCSREYLTKETVSVPESSVAAYSFSSGSTLSASTSGGDIKFESLGNNQSDAVADTSVAISFYPTSAISVTYTSGYNGNRGYLFDGNIDFQFVTPATTLYDNTPPTAPGIETFVTEQSAPTLSGTAEAYTTVDVSVAGGSYQVVADASGQWSINTADDANFVPNLNGANEVVVVSTDSAGNASADTTVNELVIDSQAPGLTSIERLSPLAAYTNADSVIFKLVFSEPVTQLDLGDFELTGSLVASSSLLSIQTSDNIEYELTVSVPAAANGDVGIAVSVGDDIIDQVGNTLDSVAPATNELYIIDNQAPASPILFSPANGSLLIENQVTISGSAEAGTEVIVYDDGLQTCATNADTDGQWSCSSPALSDRSHPFTAVATDLAGNTSTPSASVTVIIDANAPTAPIISNPIEDAVVNTNQPQFSGTSELSTSVTVRSGATTLCSAITDASGNWTCSSTVSLAEGGVSVDAVAVDSADRSSPISAVKSFIVNALPPAAPQVLTPANGIVTSENLPVVSGSAELGSIEVFVGGSSYCSTISNGQSNWNCSGTVALVDGQTSITAKVTDAFGDTSSASSAVLVTIDTLAPEAPAITSPIDGDELAVTQINVSGSAEAGSGVDVYDGASLLCTASTDNGGSWSCSSAGSLSQGEHSLTAKASDEAGNESLASAALVVKIDTLAPSAPTVTSPNDGAVVASNNVTLTGTAEAGGSVTVSEGGAELCTTSVELDGSWTCSLVMNNTEGEHGLSIKGTDAAGNTGSASVLALILDTAAPDAPLITSPVDGGVTNVTQPVIKGSAEAMVSVRAEAATGEGCYASADSDGNWSCTVSVVLNDAAYSFTATATDLVGNQSDSSAAITINIDTQSPAAPNITSPLNNALLSQSAPVISGSAEPGSEVSVLAGAANYCDTAVDGVGAWTCSAASLNDGSYSITAISTDVAGNESATSAIIIAIDTAPPAAPSIASPAESAIVTDNTQVFSGVAEAGSTVYVKEANVDLCSATADGAGNWTCTSSQNLSEGAHSVSALAVDGAGNLSNASTPRSFTVDAFAPTIPLISSPVNGNKLATTTPVISGSGEVASTVTVYHSGSTQICSATVDSSSLWTCMSAELVDGNTYALQAKAVDTAGNESGLGTAVTVTIDTTASPAPTLNSPSNNALLNEPRPSFSGTGTATDTVYVYESGVQLCQATVDGANNWLCSVSSDLTEGSHIVTATAEDSANNVSAASDPVSFTIDLTAPVAPVIQSPASDTHTISTQPVFSGNAEASSSISVKEGTTELCSTSADTSGFWTCASAVVMSEGSHSISAVAADPAGNQSSDSAAISLIIDLSTPVAPNITSPTNGTVIGDATPLIRGDAEANGYVVVEASGIQLCSAVASADGAWSCTSTTLAEAEHALLAKVSDKAGNVSANSGQINVTLDLTAPGAPVISAPIDGDLLSDSSPTFEGTAESDSSIEVYAGSDLLCQASTTTAGTWSCVSSALVDGSHTLTAIAKDSVGNSSVNSAALTITVDAALPSAPVLSNPLSDALISENKPAFSGTSEANSTVEVKEEGALRCSTVTDSSGNWSCVSSALSEGMHTVSAVATDLAGNQSPASASLSFTVDSKAPAAPLFSSPANNSNLAGSAVEISGVAEAGSSVEVFESENTRCQSSPVTADSGGNWSCTTVNLAEGSHVLTAVATDGAGNVSAASLELNVMIDTQAPSVPVVASPVQGAILTENRPTLSGTAEANTVLEVSEGPNLLCQAVVSTTGNWSCTTLSLTQGSHTLLVDSVDDAGNRTGVSLEITVDIAVPPPPQITSPAEGAVISDTSPVISGTAAEVGTEVRVYANSISLCSALTNNSGDWSCTSSSLMDGAFTLVTTATSNAGYSSAPSATISFTLDSTPPSAPEIISPKNGQLIGTDVPRIIGSAEAGSYVTVLVSHSGGDDIASCAVTADEAGNWFCSSTNLPSGVSQFKAFSVDLAGNTSSDSLVVSVTLGVDSDSDLLMDSWECSQTPCEDSDGDGLTNDVDPDSDNDGTPDKVESGARGADSDGDGIDDSFDVDVTGGLDANNDGVDDSNIAIDTDSDGIVDVRDPDSDGDGVPDIYENQLLQADSDGDGIFDSFDVDQTGGLDDNNDGIDDNVILPDSDNDGWPNYLDTDSDNDGTSDGVELGASGQDSDLDGIDDSFDVDLTGGSDVNNDGVDDGLMPKDSDGDGTADYMDNSIDEDADGIPDILESRSDSDHDGIADYRDSDSDNDGISDSIESGVLATDSDGDGISDSYDVDQTGGNDFNGDGIDDAASTRDFDNDGVADLLDLDSDGDGIPDLNEGPVDMDHDGLANFIDVDSDNDGIHDQVEGSVGDFDSDADGIANFLDLDSDNDGIPDAQEAGANIDDINNDGRADQFLITTTPADSDLDGIFDFLDLDSNEDGFWDIPAQYQEFDQNGDGRVEVDYGDANSDGVVDVIDLELYVFDLTRDSDGDGVLDYLDVDDDNDGISDSIEGGADTDGNGFPDEATDFDSDGIPDYLDLDSDNDGIADTVEAGFTFLAQNESNINSNGSLVQSHINSGADLLDSDADGQPDYLDLDSDGDSLFDLHEIGRASLDQGNAGYMFLVSDGNQNGLNDDLEMGINGSSLRITDSDDDGVPDYLDWDSDNDGFGDYEEAGLDLNNNGIADNLERGSEIKTSLGGSMGGALLLLLSIMLTCRMVPYTVVVRLIK